MLRTLTAFAAYFLISLFLYIFLYILTTYISSLFIYVEIDGIWYIIGTIYPILFALLWFLLIVLPAEVLLSKYHSFFFINAYSLINYLLGRYNKNMQSYKAYLNGIIFVFICSLLNLVAIMIINILIYFSERVYILYLLPLYLDSIVAPIWLISFGVGVYPYYIIKYHNHSK